MNCVVGLTKKYREWVRKAELAFNEVEKRARKENKLLKEDGKMWRMKKNQPMELVSSKYKVPVRKYNCLA